MNQFLFNLDLKKLNIAFIENLSLYYKHMCSSSMNYSESKDTVSYISRIPIPIFNNLILKNFSNVRENNYAEFFERVQSTPYNVWLSSSINKNDFDKQLKTLTLRFIGESNGLGIEIEKMEKHDVPNSLFVQPLKNFEEIKLWLEIASVHFGLRGDHLETYLDIFKDANFNDEGSYWRKYLGWLNGEPISCSTLILGGGVAAVYDDAIIPRLKRTHWGIEEAMVSIPLKHALISGYKVGIVHSGVGDMRRYRAFGFKEVLKFPKYTGIPSRKVKK